MPSMECHQQAVLCECGVAHLGVCTVQFGHSKGKPKRDEAMAVQNVLDRLAEVVAKVIFWLLNAVSHHLHK